MLNKQKKLHLLQCRRCTLSIRPKRWLPDVYVYKIYPINIFTVFSSEEASTNVLKNKIVP